MRVKRWILPVSAALCAAMASFATPAGAVSDGVWDYVSVSIGGNYKPVVGNFAGDTAEDIYWYSPGSGPDTLYIGNEGSYTVTKVSVPMNEVATPIVGDFAGDEYDDILFYRPGSAVDRLWVSVDDEAPVFDTSRTLTVSGTYQPKVLRDWRAGGKDRVFWYRPGSGTDPLWIFNADGSYQSTTHKITSNLQVVPFDWNGDGMEDLLLYGPGSLPDRVWRSQGGAFVVSNLSISGTYQAVVVRGETLDDILLFGSGSRTDKYLQNIGSRFRSEDVYLPARGTAYTVGQGGAVVYSPLDRENILVEEGSTVETFYLSETRNVGANKVFLSGDFNGDEWADLLWYGPGTGSDAYWYADPPDSARMSGAPAAEDGSAGVTSTKGAGAPSRD